MAEVSKFVEKTISLLNIERKAEVDEARSIQENVNLNELQRKGVCLLKLRLRSRCTGLYGRSLLTFESSEVGGAESPDGRVLPAHRITPGDIVGVYQYGSTAASSEICSGIVSRVTQATIVVAFDDSANSQDIDNDGQYRLNQLANDVTYKRIK
ncbi:DNA-binding protein SMUBP-2, partial [Exaiptasia diaphana]|uniref:Helicase SMUBP-2/HCS1 1B domain-containing protein n=1 Tax=Exaiptasia diaphana TaxID=2652724 RepID=A0A913X9K2_EXADI